MCYAATRASPPLVWTIPRNNKPLAGQPKLAGGVSSSLEYV
jgi:hypothetical protein